MSVADLKAWWDFALYVLGDTPALKDALQLYPVGCAIAIHWTQGIKRQQRRKKWRNRENLTSLELRSLSGCLSAIIVSVMAVSFYDLPHRQILAHALLGGAAAPMIMCAVIETLQLVGQWSPRVAAYCQRVKSGDRRKSEDPQPPAGLEERRSNDDTGEFWTN